MDPNRFIAERRGDWVLLERLLDKIELVGIQELSANEARQLGHLYRRLASDLAMAQARVASRELERYLNALMARAFPLLYQQPKTPLRELWRFLSHGMPRVLYETRRMHIYAFLIFMLGGAFGFVGYVFDPQASLFFQPGQVQHFERAAKSGKIGRGVTMLAAAEFSSRIMTNNIRVSFMAFALGLTFGLGTFALLFYNGLLLGTYASVAFKYGMNLVFWSLILPHGILELSAIFFSGGAGFLLARAIILPGVEGVWSALRQEAQQGIWILFCVVPMLVVAGLIEGFVTPLPGVAPIAKIAFALATMFPLVGLFWLGWRATKQEEVHG
ncbi:MAG: chromate reductase [Deltaproteobacteria bacterium]|mgnify:CR=1 FL=1|nr:chromate reductase [Deltaproteobacteria bacterium]|tara:strand:+ start:6269 stop:7252 length:984 start_codon:yes stop_codon:yes gene_type:complete